MGSYGDQFIHVPFPPQKNDVGVVKKKKTNKQGPFYFFMMAKKAEWITEGRWSEANTMQQLVNECMPLWNIMKTNPVLLEPYIEKSREFKMRQRSGLEDVYDTFGRSMAEIRRENQRLRDEYENMCQHIQKTVENAGRKIVDKEFFVAHFNYLCKTSQNFYPPCEAAVVKFTMKDGVLAVREALIYIRLSIN